MLSYKLLLWLLLLATMGYINFRPGYEYTVASYTLTHTSTPTQQLFYSLANFDGIHYIHIAQRGYIDEARFFPVLPIAINLLSWPFRLVLSTTSATIIASLIISFGALLGVVFLLHKLESSQLPKWHLLITVLAFPTSFFLIATYTESLFLLLILLTIWFTKTKHWFVACICASLATATRLVGIVVWLGLVLEWLRFNKLSLTVPNTLTFSEIKKSASQTWLAVSRTLRSQPVMVLCLLASLTPLLLYIWYNQRVWGDYFYFLHAHQLLGNGRSAVSLVNPLVTAYRYLKILLTLPISLYEWWIALLEVLFTLVGIGSMVWASYKKILPWPWLLMCWGFLTVPALSGTLTGMPRYVLICFPLYWLLNQLPNKWWLSYVCAGIIFNLFLFLLFAHGYYIA